MSLQYVFLCYFSPRKITLDIVEANFIQYDLALQSCQENIICKPEMRSYNILWFDQNQRHGRLEFSSSLFPLLSVIG